MQKVSLMLMVVVFSTFFTTFSHTRIHDEHTHKHVTFFQWDAGRVKCLPPIEKNSKRRRQKKLQIVNQFSILTQLEMSQMKFCALVRIFFRFQPSLHWCPVFSGIFFSERNTGTSAGGQGRVVYFSREFSRSSREKETHEHTNRLQISPVILTKGKEKSKATVAFDLRALSVGGSLEGVFLTVLLMSC